MSSSILDTIVKDVRSRLVSTRREMPVSELENRPLFESAVRPFSDALRSDGLAIIAEIKKASPSQGVIRANFDPLRIALQYEEAGAEAISVLTEPTFFQGNLTYLEQIATTVGRPLLRKDFIVDPYQIVEARAYGADAVLLIVHILSRSQLAELAAAANEAGLECLVELHAEREIEKVDLDRTKMIGVNNRNLDTFDVDPSHAPRVLARMPDHIVRVAESGLKTGDDLAQARSNGIDAVLIGETFMRAPDPGACLRDLRTSAESISQNLS